KFGKYVTVMYNPAYCTVTAEVEAGVGSREEVTLKIKMRDGYIFNGWSEEKAIINGGAAKSTAVEYKFTAEAETHVYANYSVRIIYHANGGAVFGGAETYEQKYSVVWYKCPVTLPEKGYFVRDGYTLSEYNTQPDGSGTAISLGSRAFMDDEPTLDLYCIWEKQSSVEDFTYSKSGSEVTITKYNGSAATVVIPDKIDGAKVTKIASNAFKGSRSTKVILSKNVKTVESNAFSGSKIDSFVMFDSLMSIPDSAFASGQLKHLRINAALGMFNNWMQNGGTPKLDRALYSTSKGLKSIVIYGGSGAHNGLDCVQIDKALEGKYYITNVGCNANVSAAFYFDWFEDILSEDDIILWMPELGSYMLGDTWFSDRLWGITSGHYDVFRSVDISEFSNVFGSYCSYAYTHATAQSLYSDSFPTGIDVYADSIGQGEHQDGDISYDFYQSPEYYFYMADVIERITDKGTSIYFTYAAMIKQSFDVTAENFKYYTDKVKAAFPQLTFITSDYNVCLVDYQYRFDSNWHLTRAGAIVRTSQLVPDIVEQVKKEGR
ncbi:MAG: leucine-rich repeat protein, partial [Clostridia bacterium]|nr:leucine-rich repeat protein [Clostridia bacterium]